MIKKPNKLTTVFWFDVYFVVITAAYILWRGVIFLEKIR